MVNALFGRLRNCLVVLLASLSLNALAISAPSITSCTRSSSTTVRLSWTAVSGASYYVVRRSYTSSVGSSSSIGTPSGTSYTDSSAGVDTCYYWVEAWDSTGASARSGMATASGGSGGGGSSGGSFSISATKGTSTSGCTITWTAQSGATGYRVVRGTTSNMDYANILVETVTGTSYTDTTGTAGKTYYYWIVAKKSSGYVTSSYATGYKASSSSGGDSGGGGSGSSGGSTPASVPYTVAFNANGGTGTMADESFTYDTAKVLTANAFLRRGHTFKGWATSASGSVVYADKASVKNLTATAGETINLFAVWKVSHTVTINSVWGEGGSATYDSDSTVTLSAPDEVIDETGTTKYVCLGSSAYPEAGTSVTLTVTRDIDFSWDVWQTNYWVSATVEGPGVIYENGITFEDGWRTYGDVLNLAAIPNENAKFIGWAGDIEGSDVAEGKVLMLAVLEPRAIGASFDQASYKEELNAEKMGDFATDVAEDWVIVMDSTAKYAGTSVKSAVVEDYSEEPQESVLRSTVRGPGTFSFWWRSSCDEDPVGEYTWDHGELRVDGEVAACIDGITDWRQVSVDIVGEGVHTIEWVYAMDGFPPELAGTEDCIWIDAVDWTGANAELPLVAPVITPGNGSVFTTPTCTVTIACESPRAVIYYSTNGRTPSLTETYRYKGPFTIDKTTMVTAVAVRGPEKSAYVTAVITRAVPPPKPVTYTISYENLCGATHSNPLSYEAGSSLVFAAPCERMGYLFAGWTPSEITPETTGPQTVRANWTQSYKIRFIRNDGAGTLSTNAFVCGVSEKLPTVAKLGFARRGYDFGGWATTTANARNGVAWKRDGATVKDATTAGRMLDVYAIWTLKSDYYQIRFEKNDGTGKWRALGYEYGKSTALPSIDAGLGWARAGYEFKGWATSASGAVWKGDKASVATATKAGKTLVVYAVWEKEPPKYKIRFIRNDGAGTLATNAFACGVSAALPTVAKLGFARRGYDFGGWATTTADARNGIAWKQDGATVKDAAAAGKTLDVYAIWRLKSGYYQIRFEKNDGTGKWRALGYAYGTSTSLPSCDAGLGWSRAGYAFKGWATSASGSVWKTDRAKVSTAAKAGKTLVVYAIWVKTANSVSTAACVRVPQPDAPEEASLPPCLSGELATGDGAYWLCPDEELTSGLLYVVTDDGETRCASVAFTVGGRLIAAETEDGEVYWLAR